MRALLLALPLLLAAAPAATLTIAGEPFAQTDILDGRATADAAGQPAVLLTFAPGAAKRLAAIGTANEGKPVAIAVEGAEVAQPVMRGPVDGVIEIGGLASFEAATALARRISGKDPLPESIEE